MNKMKKSTRILLVFALALCLSLALGITAFATENGNVAKVGNTEYATIDEAIANWTNGTTLTLLSDVTLSDVIQLSSTEHHILDLGTYTMTAASKKDAIQIVNNGRSSASYALDIKADAENPGGITATGKAVVKTTGKSGVQDRPIIRFYNGVFTGTNVVYHTGSNGTNCPQFWFYGGEFNGILYANRAKFIFYGGTFNGSLWISVDSSADALIVGGTFKQLSNLYGSTLNADKFTIGSAAGVYDKEVYVDENGYYVVATAEPTEGVEASVAKTPSTNDYLKYSKVATEGQLNYTDAVVALKNNNTTSAKVTIYADEIDLEGINFKGTIVVPEGKTLKITNAPEGLKTEGDVKVVVPVAKIGDESFNTLADAVSAVKNGETITLLADITDNVTLTEQVGLSYTIDGNGKNFDGTITIKALSDTNDNRRITLQNIKFVNNDSAARAAGRDFITSVEASHYPHLTVKGCTFTGNGENTDVALRVKSAYDLYIEDCTGTGLHSFLQNTSGVRVTIDNVTVTESKSGLALGTVQGVTVKNCNIDVAGYGIRLDAQYNNNAVIESNEITAFIPVVVRKTEVSSTIEFVGDNNMTANNTDGYWMVAGATEYEENGQLPTAASNVTVALNDAGLEKSGIFGSTQGVSKYGTWGGIDWTLYADGTLVIAPTKGTPVPDKNAPTKRTYEVGEWRETVIYKSNGSASAVGGAPYDMKAVKKLIIEEGVTKIGSFTCQFPNLTGEVVIPSTVTYIGQEAFHKAPITKLTFAAGGTEGLCIANGAFKKTLITEVSFPGDREYIHIHHWAFGGSTKLETAYIPANVTKSWGGEHIDYFDNFNSQTNVTWAEYGSIFTGCTKMETITFENEAVRDLFFAKDRQGTADDYIVAYADLVAYNTFAEALEAVLENGGTLGLVKSATVKDPIVISADKTLVINLLNGKTLSQSKACTASYEMILNKGSLTINGNGKISFTDTSAGDPNFGWGSYTIRNEGTLVVNGGTIEHKGAQAFATHMICAIFQYSGSTTINGGTISTPNYRSIRLWKGEMTINGGTFDGQVWVQAVDNSAKLTINGGTFGPNDGDASSVFVSNATYDVEFAVTNGTFNGKIGANDATKLAGAITGGKFNAAAVAGTNEALIAQGLIFGTADENGYTSIVDDPETHYIYNVEDLKAFRDAVNNGTDYFKGVTVYLAADIDLAGENWVAIGSAYKDHGFMGNFDGNGFKIKNLTITNPALDSDGYAYAGFFGVTEGIDKDNQNFIKNLVIENVTIETSGHIVAAAIAYPYYTALENITVCGDIAIKGGDYTAGALAYTRRCVDAKNVTVAGNAGSYITGRNTVGGVISDIQMNGGLVANYSNFSVSGVTITGTKNVGGISGIIANQTLTGATVKNVTLDCSDARVGVVAGSLGGTSTIKNIVTENVTGATATVGACYDSGYLVVKNGDVYTAVASVAEVNGTKYATLAEALAVAKAGDTITFLGDITEDVTVSVKVTIDGAGKTFVGAMTLKADTTIKNVNFDGQGYNGYAITTRGANYLTIEDCTAKNYGYGFVQLASATVLTTVKNVTVSNMNYGVKVDYSGAVVIENANITANVAAVLNSNYGEKTITIKNSKLSILGTWTRNNTTKTTYVFEGENTIDQFKIDAAIDNFKLAANATLTAPNEITMTTDVAGYSVKYEGGMYVLKANMVAIGEITYASLAEALAAAKAGDTITFLADITEDVTVSVKVTINGNGKTYTGAMTLKADTTIKNVNFDGKGYNGYAITTRGAQYLTIEDCTAKNYGYGFVQLASATALTTVKNVTVSNMNYGVKIDYSGAVVLEKVDITANVAAVLNSNYGEKTITIKNSTLNILGTWTRNNTIKTNYVFEGDNTIDTFIIDAAIDTFKLEEGATLTAPNDITILPVDAENYDVEYKDGTYTLIEAGVAMIEGVRYKTLAEAFAAANDGDTIVLVKDIAMSEGIINTKKITLDLNDKTITGTDNGTASFGLITNKGELTITGNGTMTLVATNNRGWNAYSSVISNTVGGKLVVENGTIEHLGGTDMAYAIDNLTNGKGTYAETVINGGTIKSTYRAIRQFLNGVEAQNILTVNGGTIEGANKSIWVQDPSKNNNSGKITVAAGAVLNGDVYLYATAGSAEWPVEVSIAAKAVKNEVITGNMPNGYILEKKSGNWTVNEYIAKVGNKYYKTLQAAVDAANQYQSVTLLQDAEGAGVVINKKTTIDFNGFTYAVNTPVGSTGTESNGFQILAGNYTVRLLNGTLKVADDAADKFYILVQNYSDLIVQKMTLDGTNLDKYAFTDGDSYTLSNNSGNVQINASKIIANKDGALAFAFDACDKSAWGYELPSVLVYASSTIEGKIEAAVKVDQRYYATFEQAFEAAAEGKTITLLAPIVVNAGETLNLNKKVTINYTSNVAGEDMITVRGTLIVDGATLVYNNKDTSGSNVTVSTISAEPGSKVEIKSGVVKNNSKNNGSLGIYAFAIDMLTNGNMGDVTVTISGGEVISTNYMAIRQFNNGTACKNTLSVTGGYIYGAKRAIQIHMDNNAAYLAISGGTIEAGDYALCLFPKAATNVAVTGGTFIGTIYSGTNGIITGGTYDEAVYEGYIKESYKQVKVDGVYNVIFDEAYGSVATIGEQTFKSFAAAWAAATNGDTIVLQNNITIDTETFTVADGMKITLDMNGYTITVTDNSTKNYELFYIYGEMVVTGNGTITLKATNNRAWNASSGIFHNRGGVLTIENGTFTHNGGSDMAFVVDNSGNWYGDAVTTINGGTLTSSYIAIRNRMEQNTHGASGKAILNVYGGKIDGTSRAIWAQAASTSTVAPATGEINVYGGEIGLIDTARSAGAVCMTTIKGGTVANFKGESGELTVNGGKITGDITILFADGTEPVKTIIKSKVYYGAVAKMGNTYYATLADALKKCTGAQAITLLRDIEGEGFVITGKTALDFNGHTYTVTAPVAGTNVGVQINASGKTVRLINGTLKAAEGSGVEVLVENNASLTIQRQTLEVTTGTALVVTGGSASINIATIDAEGAVALEVKAGKITVYSEGKSSFIIGEKLAKKSGSNYTPVA